MSDTMFPNVIDIQIKGSKGDDLNALLKQFKELFEDPEHQQEKRILIAWRNPPFPPSDMDKYTPEEQEKIREVLKITNNADE